MWIDIASIVFVCVTANHLGLVKAVEEKTDKELRIVNCPKCFTFWSVLVYGLATVPSGFPLGLIAAFPRLLAISFLSAYLAIWLELLEGFIDTIYIKVYEKIYPNTDTDTPASDTHDRNPAGTVS